MSIDPSTGQEWNVIPSPEQMRDAVSAFASAVRAAADGAATAIRAATQELERQINPPPPPDPNDFAGYDSVSGSVGSSGWTE